MKSSNKKRTIPVIVRVSDVNDNPPVFVNAPYDTTVSEVQCHTVSQLLYSIGFRSVGRIKSNDKYNNYRISVFQGRTESYTLAVDVMSLLL